MPLDQISVRNFLRTYERALRWVSRWHTTEDLRQMVWSFALELQLERGLDIDLAAPGDATEVLRRIRRTDGRHRRGNTNEVSWDKPRFDHDGEQKGSLLDYVRASDVSDPLAALIHEEEQSVRRSKLMQLCAASFSQFSAYVLLLHKFDCIKKEAAAYLAVTAATLDRRIERAFAWIKVQPSLFDRIISLNLDMVPPQRFQGKRLQQPPLRIVQLCLNFEHRVTTVA